MNRRTSSYSISISFLIIASLIYQLPVVGAARFVPSNAASDSGRPAVEDALFLPTSTASATQNITTTNSAALSDANSGAPANPLGVLAASITATLADDILLAVKKNPGDTITYTAIISNGGSSPADDATGVIFSSILDANTTLVPLSVNAQPIATADAYTASGNIPISLAAPGVLTNDVDPMTGTNAGLTVTEVQGSGANVGAATNTTATGLGAVNGSVTLNANGSFTYEPPPGFTGTDTFTYKTSEGTLTDTNTVTITISNMVWFIKNTGGGLNRGTFSNPFTTIATFNTANAVADVAPNPKSGDFISLRSGTYTEADGVNLRNTQKLIGEAVQFSTVFTADANSSSAYTTFAGATNTAPTINTTAGHGIDLSSSNTVRGLNVGNTPGFFGFNGGAVGSPVINTVNVTGTGGAMNVSTSGAFGANVTFGTFESSSSATQNLNLVGVTGTLGITSGGAGLSGSAVAAAAINVSGGSVSFTYPGNVTKGNANSLLSVSGGHTGGTLTFQTGTLSAAVGDGLQFNNADGTYNFNGTTTLNGGDAGVDILTGSGGTFSFASGAAITNPTGIAFNVNASAPAGMTYSGNITANNNRAVSISNGAAAACGTQTFQTGSITGSGASASGIIVNNCNAGTITFSGSGQTLTTQANNGVTLTNNGGATINFTGGNLDVITTTGKPFTATGGGTVSVTGGGNTLTTENDGAPAGGMILEVTDTISGGITFATVTGHGGSSTAKGVYIKSAGSGGVTLNGGSITNYVQKGIHVDSSNNITLNNVTLTGNGTANLDPAGTCGDNLNGTNTNCAAGIDLQTVTTVNLSGVHVSGGVQQGINGKNVTSMTLTNVEVNNAGNETNESGIQLHNLFGTLTWSAVNSHDNASRQLNVQNSTSTALGLTINNTGGACTFSNTAWPGSTTSAQGILFAGTNSANMTISVQSCTIARNFGPAFNAISGTGAVVNSTVNAGSLEDNGQHFVVALTGNGSMTYALTGVSAWVDGTPVTGHSQVTPISIFLGNPSTGSITGTISGNTFGQAADDFSAACFGGCNAISVNNGNSAGTMTATISGNTIQRSGGGGIQTTAGSGSGTDSSILKVKILNNILKLPDGNGTGLPILATKGASVGDTTATCANILNNDVSGGGGSGTWNMANAIRLRNPATAGAMTLPGYTGAATDYAAIVTYLQGRNTITAGSASVQNANSFSSTAPPGSDCFLMLALGGVNRFDETLVSGIFDNDQFSTIGRFANVSGMEAFHYPSNDSFDSGRINGPAAETGPDIAASLSPRQLAFVASAAIDRWKATGLTAQQLDILRRLKFEISDLAGVYLGEADGNRILVDRDAGGKGWYIGSDSLSDSLFNQSVSSTRRNTYLSSAPAGHVDLVTTIEHEMGHKLGLDDSYAERDRNNLMYGYLTVGERRLPARGQAKGAQSSTLKGSHFLSLSPSKESREIWSAVASAARHRFGLATERIQSAAAVGALQRKNHATTRAITPIAPFSGETVTVNGSGSGFTLPAGDSITITFQATVNNPPGARSVSTQGQVSGSNFTTVNTDDPETGTGGDATVTNVNVVITWDGSSGTDFDTPANWDTNAIPVPINDVVVANAANQPTLSNSDPAIYSLIVNTGSTLTISNRTLTISGGAGSDLTLNGVISGGALQIGGAGPHVINNAGGTGSLSSTNVTTLLSPASVTLNNNLQMGALAINNGATMNLTNRTLSLNGPGAALSVGGAIISNNTTSLIFNGTTGAQTTSDFGLPNVTINNAAGVTLTGSALVSLSLTLTSGNLSTGAFTLSLPAAGTITRTSGHVIGNLSKTFGAAPPPFIFHVGTANGYSPLNTTITAGTGTLTVAAIQGPQPNVNASTSLQRYWTLTGSGLTANLTFNYLLGDVMGNENIYKVIRVSGGTPVTFPASTVNTGTHQASLTGVSSFSDWTVGEPVAPTGASGIVRGTITDSNGTPVEGAVVRLNGDQTRKTITDAKGRYYFDNVEANRFYTVTPSRVNYNFNPFNRSFNQMGNQTEAGFGGIFTGDNANPLDTPEYFVRQQYVDLLGREPDEGGFNYWSDEILRCGNDADCVQARRSDIAAAFFIEQEFQQSGAFIYNLYQGSLGRKPLYGEYATDRKQVVGGPTLDADKVAFADSFVQRAEFVTKYQSHTTADSFVDALLEQVWESSKVDLAGDRGLLLAIYGTGSNTNQSRSLVLRQVIQAPSFKEAEYNPAFVLTEYFGYLRRNPEPEGYDFWLNVLNNREPGNFRGMVCSFITSTEYQKRFSSVVTHSNGECGR